MNVLMCPVCSDELVKNNNKYICKNNHSFDVSRKGYVNLLMSNASGNKRHGDDKMMVEARRDFLNKGYYRPLADEISKIIVRNLCQTKDISVFECGCGDCYYMEILKKHLDKNLINNAFWGCDISKEVLPYGKKRMENSTLFVASATKLPILDNSIDVAMSVFAPCNFNEFSRVVKNGGIVVKVIPLEKHLIELKENLYKDVYLNRPVVEEHSDFEIITNVKQEYVFEITNREDLENLFKMTPYYYKTGIDAQKKLLSTDKMKITASFGIICYKKIK